MPMPLLRYTGHPFVDVGVATLTATAGVETPGAVQEDHLGYFAEEILDLYLNPVMAGFLAYAVFANARFANPAQLRDPKYLGRRQHTLDGLLHLWRDNAPIPEREDPADAGEKCVFSGDPAIIRAGRMYVPMITDETNISFMPEGRPKLPISGWCLLALMAMPLGCLNYQGQMLWLVHSSNTQALQYFAKLNLERNRQSLQIQGLAKYPRYEFVKTQLISDLVEAQAFPTRGVAISAYLFSSSNQASRVRIFHLPSSMVRFVRSAQLYCPRQWGAVVERAKSKEPDPIEVKEDKAGKSIINRQRNYFYEDLFDLPAGAASFLRRYLLRVPLKLKGKPTGAKKFDPRYSYSYLSDRDAISWELTELFLERVMQMEKERITAIRDFGDKLADFIRHEDPRLFRQLFIARSDYQMRLALLRAGNAADANLLDYDQFIQVFFVDEGDTLRPDWYLARDLLMIRIIEQLHCDQWMEEHSDLVESANEAMAEGEE